MMGGYTKETWEGLVAAAWLDELLHGSGDPRIPRFKRLAPCYWKALIKEIWRLIS